jgi:sulfur relay (sulfurtransferase) complex TusBCD TusD component (DsrE family)
MRQETSRGHDRLEVKTLVILNDPAYGTERSYNGLRLAHALAKREGEEVRIFLLADAVTCALAGQQTPTGYYNLERMLAAVIRHGAQVGLCGTCMDARALREDQLVTGAHRSALEERRLERAGKHPIVPPSLLRLPGMRRGLLIAVPFFCGFGAFMFVVAITLQQGAHLGPLRSGVSLVPMALAFLAASLVTARLTARYGRRVLAAGALLQGVGLSALAATLFVAWPHVDPLNLAPAMAIAGAGQGLVMSPLFGVVLAGVPSARAGVGSGILTTTQQTALALGVATLGSLFLSLSPPHSLGMRDAFVVVLAVQTAVAALVAFGSRAIPHPPRQAAEGTPGAVREEPALELQSAA